jgi:hypothetical protein
MVVVYVEGIIHPPICLFDTLFSCQYLFKAITSYKKSGSKPVKNVIGRYKINLVTVKSYKNCNAMTEFIS